MVILAPIRVIKRIALREEIRPLGIYQIPIVHFQITSISIGRRVVERTPTRNTVSTSRRIVADHTVSAVEAVITNKLIAARQGEVIPLSTHNAVPEVGASFSTTQRRYSQIPCNSELKLVDAINVYRNSRTNPLNDIFRALKRIY